MLKRPIWKAVETTLFYTTGHLWCHWLGFLTFIQKALGHAVFLEFDQIVLKYVMLLVVCHL